MLTIAELCVSSLNTSKGINYETLNQYRNRPYIENMNSESQNEEGVMKIRRLFEPFTQWFQTIGCLVVALVYLMICYGFYLLYMHLWSYTHSFLMVILGIAGFIFAGWVFWFLAPHAEFDTGEKGMKIFIFYRIIAIILLVIAVFQNPYWYYVALRVIICGISLYSIRRCIKFGALPWIILFGSCSILFNPFVPIHLNKILWMTIDIGVAGLFTASIIFIKIPKQDLPEIPNLQDQEDTL